MYDRRVLKVILLGAIDYSHLVMQHQLDSLPSIYNFGGSLLEVLYYARYSAYSLVTAYIKISVYLQGKQEQTFFQMLNDHLQEDYPQFVY